MSEMVKTQESEGIQTWNTGFKRELFILRELVSKDFKLKYRRSVLGVLWSVLNPLLMMVVMSIVFSVFFRAQIDYAPYPLYLIVGNILFTLMADSTNQGMVSIISAAPLLKKVKIKRMVFPIEKVVFAMVNFAISLIAVVLVMLWFKQPVNLNIFWAPLCLVYFFLFCCGLSLLLSAMAVFFRDVIHLWGVVITAWTYLTPIFYTMSALPAEVQRIIYFNPMYQYINYFRECVLAGHAPSLGHNLMCLTFGVVVFLIGYFVFKRNEHKFILYI